LNYRAKELDLELPLLESLLPSNESHFARAVRMVLATKKKKVAVLGLSFKTATDDLRESPQVQLVKLLLGEGCEIKIWDDNVSLGRLIGSNRQYIQDVIPHIGSLLNASLDDVLNFAEVVVIGAWVVRTLNFTFRPSRCRDLITWESPDDANLILQKVC
jgi:GDP-mannose 6-dehydrogenase